MFCRRTLRSAPEIPRRAISSISVSSVQKKSRKSWRCSGVQLVDPFTTRARKLAELLGCGVAVVEAKDISNPTKMKMGMATKQLRGRSAVVIQVLNHVLDE